MAKIVSMQADIRYMTIFMAWQYCLSSDICAFVHGAGLLNANHPVRFFLLFL